MLLIKFYGNFCSFHRLYILKIRIHLKHEKINWNSELQNLKVESKAENRELQKALANFARIFPAPAKFHKAAKIHSPCEISQFIAPAN